MQQHRLAPAAAPATSVRPAARRKSSAHVQDVLERARRSGRFASTSTRDSVTPVKRGPIAQESLGLDTDTVAEVGLDAALVFGPPRRGSLKVDSVLSMSEGAALLYEPEPEPARASNSALAGADWENPAGVQAHANRATTAANLARQRTMGPQQGKFGKRRKKSLFDRVLLNETERTTRNPTRYGLDHLVIHPSNRAKAVFDVAVLAVTLYSLGATPLQFAYGLHFNPELELLVDLLFLLDVLLHFFAGFVERGYPVLSLRRIAYEYASGWCAHRRVAAADRMQQLTAHAPTPHPRIAPAHRTRAPHPRTAPARCSHMRRRRTAAAHTPLTRG
jgi:hypothetical protein